VFGDDLGTVRRVDWLREPECGHDKNRSEATP
jgi:hypothetical protein